MPTVLALSELFLSLRFWEPFFRTLKETNGNGFALSRKFQPDPWGSGEEVSDKEINRSARGSPAGLDAKTVKVNPLINRNENWFSAQKTGQVFILFKLVEIVFFIVSAVAIHWIGDHLKEPKTRSSEYPAGVDRVRFSRL